MKILLLFLIVLFIGCTHEQEKEGQTHSQESLSFNSKPDKETQQESFNVLRLAAFNGDIDKMKQFFSFPILDSSNLWELISMNTDSFINTKEVFTFENFKHYYSSIFPVPFAQTINYIDPNELFKKGSSESTPFVLNNITYIMYADWDKEAKTLQLHLYSEQLIENGDEDSFKDEFSIIYQWKFDNNGNLKLKRVDFAG